MSKKGTITMRAMNSFVKIAISIAKSKILQLDSPFINPNPLSQNPKTGKILVEWHQNRMKSLHNHMFLQDFEG